MSAVNNSIILAGVYVFNQVIAIAIAIAIVWVDY